MDWKDQIKDCSFTDFSVVKKRECCSLTIFIVCHSCRELVMSIDLDRINFKAITSDDLGFLYKLYASSRREKISLTGWPKKQIEEFLRDQFLQEHSSYIENYPQGWFTIIRYNEHLIGRVYVNYADDEIKILDIKLLPQWQKRGIGARIIKIILEKADEKGVPVRIYVEESNPVMSYFKQFGFTQSRDFGMELMLERDLSSNFHKVDSVARSDYRRLKSCLYDIFDVYNSPATYVKMRLVELEEIGNKLIDRYSAYFVCDELFELDKGNYTFSHKSFDKRDLYILPIEKKNGVVTYQALFSFA